MKTFLLSAVACYTEGSMLIVVESLEKFKQLYKKYHAKKNRWLIDNGWLLSNWDKRDELNKQFQKENNNQPYDFEIDTGSHYLQGDSPVCGNLKSEEINILNPFNNEKTLKEFGFGSAHWYVVKEFESNLPSGTHYHGDYCA